MSENGELNGTSAVMLLLQRLSDAQIDQGRALSKTASDQHDIKMSLALLTARLEPLTSVHKETADLSLMTHRHRDQIAANVLKLTTLEASVLDLQAESNKRSGWETFGGKMVYLVGGGVIAAIGAAVLQALAP